MPTAPLSLRRWPYLVALMPLAAVSVLALATMQSQPALAQSSDSSSSLAQPASNSTLAIPAALKNKKFDPDTEITDTKIQADAGSLSRYSVKAALSYNGPRVGDVSNSYQPDPDHSVGVHETSMGGSVGARYRIDKDRTLSFGTGLSALTPLHGIQRVDVNSPYLSYDLTRKFGGYQTRLSPGVSYVTVPNYRAVGEYGGTNVDFSVVHAIADTKWAASLDGSASYFLYSRPYRPSDYRAQRSNIGLYPGVKYNLTDKVNLNTSLSITYWTPRSDDDIRTEWNKTVSDRLGVGWSISRDIYVFPYLNWYPTLIALNTTTINLSTSFSIL